MPKDQGNEFDNLDNKISDLKRKKHELVKQVQYQKSNNYRKDRARRLIETGALVEKYFDISHLSIEEREEVFKMFSPFIKANIPKKYIKK